MEIESQNIVRPDAKGRISLGALAKGISSFRLSVDRQQRIILEPFAEVPAREKWLLENREALASLMRGMAESKAGKTTSLGSFARYKDEDAGE